MTALERTPPAEVDLQQKTVEAFTAFLLQAHASELEAILLKGDVKESYCVEVSLLELANANYGLVGGLLSAPLATLQLLNEGLCEAQKHLLQRSPRKGQMSEKARVQGRIAGLAHHLDACQPSSSPSLAGIRSAHVGRLITVAATVARTGTVKVFEGQRYYECTRCKKGFVVAADPEAGWVMRLPQACPSLTPCKGTKFRHVEEEVMHSDWQEVRMQERAACLGLGALPASFTTLLLDDLADTCQPGDDVEVTGVIIRQWRSAVPGQRCDVALLLLANHVRVVNHQRLRLEVGPDSIAVFEGFWAAHETCPLRGRNKILASICPQLYGLFGVKLAVALMLAGGVARQDDRDTRIRGHLHLLLVGDPGTGKSQFLKYAAKLASRAVVTSGAGSSAAGLTACAVREGGAWALEAGALVLADGGLCCIDEFDGVREADRAALHEAMEQQTLSIAKAGLMTTLPTRTTVFGVTNPKGSYDVRESLAANTSLSGPLLSRFDIVLVLLDDRNAAWDEMISDHVLCCHQAGGDAALPVAQGWPLEMVRGYLQWVKGAFQPVLSAEAEALLTGYYQLQRQAADRVQARTTIRMLESLIRISQAHARLMARHTVIQQDAAVAVSIMESCMHNSPLLGTQNTLHTGFDEDPDSEFAMQEHRILSAVRMAAIDVV